MDLRALRYFVTTVETGSISSAANSLHIAQPSVSMAISKLESELGTQLLRRSKSGTNPTPDGETLYRQAKSLLHHAEAITLLFTDSNLSKTLTIAVSPTVSLNHLGRLIKQLNTHFPKLQCRVKRDDANADFHILPAQQVKDEALFLPMITEQYQLIVPKHNILAYAETVSIGDLHGQRFILRSFCERNQEFLAFLQQTGTVIDIIAEVDNEEWAMQMVEQGLGSTILPLSDTDADDRKFIARNIDMDLEDFRLERTVGIAVDYNLLNQTWIQEIVDLLRQQTEGSTSQRN